MAKRKPKAVVKLKFKDKETASWVVRNFYISIEDSYKEGAPRLEEAKQILLDCFEQLGIPEEERRGMP